MGGSTRIKERILQTAGSKKTFTPTLSNRTETTYKEAEPFAMQLKNSLRQIRALQTATEAMLASTSRTLGTPLPRVYDADQRTGKAVATFDQMTEKERLALAEEDVNMRDLEAIKQHTTSRMELDVLRPMEMWLKLYKTFPKKLARIEKERLDFDAERRAFNKVEVRKLKRDQGSQPSAKIDSEYSYRETALHAKKRSFEEYEQEVWQELSMLVKDAKSLRTYLVAAMRVQEQAFSSATMGQTATLDMSNPVAATNGAAEVEEPRVRTTGVNAVTTIQHSPLTENAPVNLAQALEAQANMEEAHAAGERLRPMPAQMQPAAEPVTEGVQFSSDHILPAHTEAGPSYSHAGSVPQPSTPNQLSPRGAEGAELPRHENVHDLTIPPQLSLEEELPSVPHTPAPEGKSTSAPTSQNKGLVSRLLGVGA